MGIQCYFSCDPMYFNLKFCNLSFLTLYVVDSTDSEHYELRLIFSSRFCVTSKLKYQRKVLDINKFCVGCGMLTREVYKNCNSTILRWSREEFGINHILIYRNIKSVLAELVRRYSGMKNGVLIFFSLRIEVIVYCLDDILVIFCLARFSSCNPLLCGWTHLGAYHIQRYAVLFLNSRSAIILAAGSKS